VTRRDIPNLITIVRIVLVIPILWLLLNEKYGWALILFGVAGVSDGLDGFLAKHYGWKSRLGSLLDPLADKLLLVSSFLVLGWLEQIPRWLVALVVLRDVVILTGALVYHFRIERVEAAPSLISKLNTLLQILLVVLVVLHNAWLSLATWVIQVLVWGVVATTVLSGIDYVWVWSRRAVRARGKS
jgi:cardiolipin synthase